MSERVTDNQLKEKEKPIRVLLAKRLEQLGYQCISDSCDRFTTLRLAPIEIKRKEETFSPPSE